MRRLLMLLLFALVLAGGAVVTWKAMGQAKAHTTAAQQRPQRSPLRQLGFVPVVGRDVRVAQVVAASATRTARATREVVTALQPVQTRPPTQASIQRAADALLALHATLDDGLERVRPNRQHPRPTRSGSARVRSGGAAGRPPVGGGVGGQGGDGTSPPVAAPAGGGPGGTGPGALGRRPRVAAGTAGTRPAGGPGEAASGDGGHPGRRGPRLRLG